MTLMQIENSYIVRGFYLLGGCSPIFPRGLGTVAKIAMCLIFFFLGVLSFLTLNILRN